MLQRGCFFAFLTISVSLAPGMWAQSSTGEIDVSVTDVSEAAIIDAGVTITGSETGALVRQVRTNATGLAQAPLLNPGIYDIKVEKEGFRTVLRSKVALRVTEVLALRVSLEIGTATQTITIAGEAPLVDTSSN